jgi:hypothetical protein
MHMKWMGWDLLFSQVTSFLPKTKQTILKLDDANVPSLISLPYLGVLPVDDPVYQATRQFILSPNNPWYFDGMLYSNSLFMIFVLTLSPVNRASCRGCWRATWLWVNCCLFFCFFIFFIPNCF